MSQTKEIRDGVERELSYDPVVDASDISVKNINGDDALTLAHCVAVGVEATAKDGIITLTGEVRCGAERAAAERRSPPSPACAA